jgi:hypothetical protein
VGRSLALVVPLLVLYEVCIQLLSPDVRNSADLAVSEFVHRLPADGLLLVRRVVLGVLVLGVLWWCRSGRPRAKEARPYLVLFEAFCLAVLLGPALQTLVGHIGLSAVDTSLVPRRPIWLPLLLSVGAGLWEEIVFRLGLLGGMAVLLRRGFRLAPPAALGIAVLLSALAFSLYHHMGVAGEPFAVDRFAFRACAGTILGLLFVWRGFAVVVYMHVFYDVLCDLRLLFV